MKNITQKIRTQATPDNAERQGSNVPHNYQGFRVCEKWRDIKGYEGYYQVSNEGRVRSLDRIVYKGYGDFKNRVKGKVLSLSLTTKGYYFVGLNFDGVCKIKSVSRLVAQNFIKNPKKKPCVNHIDNNPLNNSVKNLEWVTYKENSRHAMNQGRLVRGERVTSSKLKAKEVLEIRSLKDVEKYSVISKRYGVSNETVFLIWNRSIWKHI